MSNNKHDIIKLRRGTAAEWAASEPQPGGEVLKLGEPGYETDNKKLKIGDGVTPWNSLPYIGGGSGNIIINPEDIQDIIGNNFLISGSGINISYNDNFNSLTISTTGLQPSGNYSIVGHNHPSIDITDFNSAVSGLLPVKNIVAGTGIGVTSNSGIYTINSSSTIVSDTLEPDGFVNRTDSIISFNDSSREFNISPKNPAISYSIYNNGVKVVKNTTEIITLPDITALYFIHFDKSTNNLSYKTTSFNFDTDIPIAQIYYNADDNKAVYFGEERHGIRMDASTHRYLHNVFGTQYINGLSISNYTILGNGSNNNDATIAIGNGLIYDEDIEANITHSNTPTNPFEQILYPVAQIPVYYKIGSNGAWTNTIANNFPVKTGTTIQYNLLTGSTWTTENSPNPTNDRYISYWICATTQENAPIISIMGQRIDSSLEQATSNNSWGDLNLNGLPIVELRPLYRLIYDTKNTLTNSPKGFLVNVLDIRGHVDTVTGLTQNDHGNLYGLADDDHYQYMHIDNSRSINAIHTFNNGFNASGLINAASGNFTLLTVIYDTSAGHTGNSALLKLDAYDNSNDPFVGSRIQLSRFRGTQIAPSGVLTDDTLSVIRTNTVDASGIGKTVARILTQADGEPTGINLYTPTRMTFNTSSGPNQLDNSLILSSDGRLSSNGYISINQTNNRLDPAPNSGKNYGLGIYVVTSGLAGSTNPNTPHTIYGIGTNVSPRSSNNNHTMYYYGNVAGVYSELPSGVANSGAIYGSVAGAWRNTRGSNVGDGWYDDNGTLSQLFGSIINYGHSIGQSGINGPAPTGVNPYTENAYGLYIAPHKGYGTINTAYDLLISDTNYNTGTINNHYAIYQIGNRPSYLAGNLTIDNGLSAPTTIYSLGTVSGNTAISYSIDTQIQKLTLNGNAVNFTEGTGWDIVNKSLDVMLEITVSATTTVSFDASFITDWYNSLPTFSPGKYLVLLRSMGTGVVQGHYIGNKIN